LILVRALWSMGGFDMRSSCLLPAVNSPLLVFMVQCPVMDDVEARTRQELVDILAVLTELTGLPSRWSGRVELVPEADFKGRKRQICDIQIDAALATQDARWATLIHEALHSVSADYNGVDFRTSPGWEEGVVEKLQRMLRPVILTRLSISVDPNTFVPGETQHQYNKYIEALTSLSQALNYIEAQFFHDLLKMPIGQRPTFVFGLGNQLPGQKRVDFFRLFSVANSLLKDY